MSTLQLRLAAMAEKMSAEAAEVARLNEYNDQLLNALTESAHEEMRAQVCVMNRAWLGIRFRTLIPEVLGVG